MYNHETVSLCIIDDIKSVVDGLTAMSWEDQGIQVAGVSGNGEEGLKLITEVRPDLVITDIRMPRMDGLSMLRAVLEDNRSCKVILISGYADFEYAQQAVQLGAFDFVVKPFSEEDIMAAVLRAKAEILEERSRRLSLREMEIKLRESMPVLRQEYFTLLVSHRTSWEQAAGRWEFLNIELNPRGFVVMLIEIDRFQEQVAELSIREVELIRFSLLNITQETIAEYAGCAVFRARHNRYLAVMNDTGPVSPIEIAEQCCRNIERYTKFTVSVGVGGRVEETSELPDSYRQAHRALAHHLFTEGNAAIMYDDLHQTGSQEPLALEYKDELLLALRSGNAGRADAILSAIAETLHPLISRQNPDYLLSLYDELAASAIRTFYELVPYRDIQPLIQKFRAVQGTAGLPLASLQRQLLALCTEGAGLVRQNSLSEGQKVIYEAIDYIKSRLPEDITVGECAAHVHLSASYFSSLFKKVTGMTVTQFTTSERIQKAKALLVEGAQVQEVASAVGYEERRYFSEMFKKITGQTPTEFRAGYHPDQPER
ncbi:response regulator [Paenibacillus riograndensis]|uniref:Two component AraC family transcriptional regulator n=3 Tax=Paenibacillus riograndensis TaxID=483937 RepID=A0A0E4H9K2_9BACL|nr:response regulator [Paenibacillus riograndensis]CQR54327.1 two component AraC family transcriptional regulator [Paenibacillus riograndensis SBR5]